MDGNPQIIRDHVLKLLNQMNKSQEANQRQAAVAQRQDEMIRTQQQTLEVLVQLVGQRGKMGPNGSHGGGRAHVEGSNTHIPAQSSL